MSLAVRHAAKAFPEFLRKAVAPAQQVPERLLDWLTGDSHPAPRADIVKPGGNNVTVDAQAVDGCSTSTDTQGGTYYEVYIGAKLKLYSSKNNEDRLRNMHVENHRELPIAVLAARVADYLWPNCQEMVDEAVAKSKDVRRQQALAQDEIYVPPEIPHLLPFTSWIRNNEVIRESFICDNNTRYKPRMSWYNPNDGMIPSGWWSEGLLGDLMYYKPLCGTRKPEQKW